MPVTCSKTTAIASIKRFLPWTEWLFHYKIRDLQYDIVAGLTVGLTLVPQCMAYAQMAGVKPEYGLYSSFLAQFVYVLFGTSKDASIGPSAIVSMILGQIQASNPLSKDGDITYLAIMSLMSGCVLLLIGILKLGFIVNLFSIPVISGFTTAAGFSIIASQLKSFFGLLDAPNDSPGVFMKQIANVFVHWNDILMYDVAFGLSTIGFLLFMQYTPLVVEKLIERSNKKKTSEDHKPSGKLSAGQLLFMEYLRLFAATRNVLVFVGTTAAAYLLLTTYPATFEGKLTVVGEIKEGFPPFALPSMEILSKPIVDNATNTTSQVVLKTTGDIFNDLVVSIVIVPLMQLMEMFAITKSLGRKNGYRVDATNELLAVGTGNVLQSFIQAFPVTAAVARCALNDQCRVKTQLGSVLSATIVMIAIGLLTETFFYIPKAALAGIIMTAAYNLIDFRIVQPMAKEYWRDLIILTLTFCLCLFFDMAYGILIMILVNMITFLRPIVRMQIYISHEKRIEDGEPVRTTIVQLSHGMKYPSADKFLDRMARVMAKSGKHVVLDCRFFTGVDYTGLQALRGILLIAFKMNKHIIFTNMSERVQKKLENIGLDHWTYADNVLDAVKTYNEEENVEPATPQTDQQPVTEPASGLHRRPSALGRLISITRHQSHLNMPYLADQHHQAHHHPAETPQHRSRATTQVSSSSSVGGRKEAPSRQLSKDHRAGGKHEQADDQQLDEKERVAILRNLSRTAFFYQDIPLTVGNIQVDNGSDDDSDIVEEDDELTIQGDDGDNNNADSLAAIMQQQHQHDEQAHSFRHASTLQHLSRASKPSPHSASEATLHQRNNLLVVPMRAQSHHDRIGQRFSRISENILGEEAWADEILRATFSTSSSKDDEQESRNSQVADADDEVMQTDQPARTSVTVTEM